VTYAGPDPDYQGAEVCFGATSGDGSLLIVDVTDKQNPTLIAEAPYPSPADEGDYSHQGWLTDDGRYFLLDDEFDEGSFDFNTRTLVMNVEDLDDPEFYFEYFAETSSTDHNLFVHDGYVYQANYTAGLRILDLAAVDGGTLTEAAYFDTHPEGDPVGFDGAFGVYPFFESGIVVVSDMARGLFVLQPRLNPATDVAAEPSASFTLAVFPNPSGARTVVELTVPSTETVEVSVYDVLGRRVAEVFAGPLRAGETRQFVLGAAGLPGGSYVVRAQGETFEATRSVTLVR
jgi:hypothetical protein